MNGDDEAETMCGGNSGSGGSESEYLEVKSE